MMPYFIYELNHEKFKQYYAADAKDRTVELTGEPRRVVQKYVAVGEQTRLESAARLYGGYVPPSVPTSAEKLSTPSRPAMSTLRMKKAKDVKSTGTSEGVRKAWETRKAGGGGGKADRSEQITKASRRVSRLIKLAKKYGRTDAVKTLERRHRALGVERRKLGEGGLSGTGYKGYEKATAGQRQKTRGGSKSEMAPRLMGAAHIRKLVTDFEAACAGGYKPRMEAKTPEGCEDLVRGLKKNPKVDNPWAVANWAHSEGRC